MCCESVGVLQDKLNIYTTQSTNHLPTWNRRKTFDNSTFKEHKHSSTELHSCRKLKCDRCLHSNCQSGTTQQLKTQYITLISWALKVFTIKESAWRTSNMQHFKKLSLRNLNMIMYILFIFHKAFPILYYAYERIGSSLQKINMKAALYFRDM